MIYILAFVWAGLLAIFCIWMVRKKPFRRKPRPHQHWDFIDPNSYARRGR